MEVDNTQIIYIITDLIMPLVVGYFLNRWHVLSNEAANRLISFNVIGVYTALTLLSFWSLPITWELAMLIPFGMLYVLVPGIIGTLTFARRHKNLLSRGAYVMSAMLSNIGTLGGVCAFILYKEPGFAYSQIIGTCQNVLLVLVCFPLAQYYHNKHHSISHRGIRRISLRDMFISWKQLSLLGIAAGITLNMNHVPRPEILGTVFHGLVHFGAWTALLPVGFLIRFSHARYYYSRVWDLPILRFMVMPLIIWGASHLIFSDPVLLNTLFICSMAPTAINAVLACRIYKLNVDLAVTSFILTTGLFLFIIFPAFVYLWN